MIKKYIKFFLFACLCFIIADIFVNADERDNFIVPSGAQFYDNNNGSLTSITTDFINNAGDKFYMSSSIHTIPNSSGAAIGFNLNEPLIAGYVYTISVSVGPIGCGETRLSSANRIGVAGSLGSAQSYYQNGGNASIRFSDYQVAGQSYKGISFAFVPNTSGTYIILPYTTANNCSDVNYFYGYTINNLGSANNVSQQDINNSINNQTNIIQNSINDMSQDIQNGIKDNFNDCYKNIFDSNSYISSTFTNISISNNNLTASADSSWKTITYNFSVTPNEVYTLYYSSPDDIAVYYYNHDNVNYYNLKEGSYSQITPTTNNLIIRLQNTKGGTVHFNNLMLVKGSISRFIPYGQEYCSNKIDETNKELGDINDSINNSNTDGAQDSAGGFFDNFTTDTHGLTAIITAPLSLISSITSKSCSPLVVPLPYVDKDLTLPCMGTIYSNHFGSFLSIYQMITFGIVAYWVCVRIFNLVKDFKNPDHDEIEVLDL